MSAELTIVRADDPDAVRQPIAALLARFNREMVGDGDRKPFALTIEAPGSGEILGGLWAYALWGSFYVNMVIVPEAARGTGLGSELMRPGRTGGAGPGLQPRLAGHLRLPGARLLRASRLRCLRLPGRPHALLSALLHAEDAEIAAPSPQGRRGVNAYFPPCRFRRSSMSLACSSSTARMPSIIDPGRRIVVAEIADQFAVVVDGDALGDQVFA